MGMDIGWAELGRYLGGAFALYLVLEGILPFVNPAAAKRLMAKLSQGPVPTFTIGFEHGIPVHGIVARKP